MGVNFAFFDKFDDGLHVLYPIALVLFARFGQSFNGLCQVRDLAFERFLLGEL